MREEAVDASWSGRPASVLLRLLAVADDPNDDDDVRRRKRVGVAGGYLTILAPLTLPIQAGGHQLSWLLAVGLSSYSVVNLVTLQRTGNFERFVVALIGAGAVFVPAATLLGGGITGSSSGLVWGFLIPAYAILALGPRRATPWFGAYLALVALMAVADPMARAAIGPPPYLLQLVSLVQNTVLPLAITFLLLRYTDVRRLAAEAKVDELLTNAIPRTIAARLRRGERRIADLYPSTTILFADIVGFTPWAQQTPPERVVVVLDQLFSSFDDLAEQHGLEKIKTIGDAYMAVAGAPAPRDDHADAAVRLALAMIETVADFRDRADVHLEVRVGLASGPAIGGVIGQRRLLFDLWGDTVNVAARMESSGVPGAVQLAESTRRLLARDLDLVARDIDVKGLGPMRTYLLVGAGGAGSTLPATAHREKLGAGPGAESRV